MAKISIGNQTRNSTTRIKANLAHGSQFEIVIGDARDMSLREIEIIEREAGELAAAIDALDKAISHAERGARSKTEMQKLRNEARAFTADTKKVVTRKQWRPVSANKLVTAAQAIGAGAGPIINAAAKVVGLLQQIQGG
jgi:hypothetical protein